MGSPMTLQSHTSRKHISSGKKKVDESMDLHQEMGMNRLDFFYTGSANRPLGASENQRKQSDPYLGIG
jgi:hypothetical protein